MYFFYPNHLTSSCTFSRGPTLNDYRTTNRFIPRNDSHLFQTLLVPQTGRTTSEVVVGSILILAHVLLVAVGFTADRYIRDPLRYKPLQHCVQN